MASQSSLRQSTFWLNESFRAVRTQPFAYTGVVVFSLLASGLLSSLPIVGMLLASLWMPYGAILTGLGARDALSGKTPGYGVLGKAFSDRKLRNQFFTIGILSAMSVDTLRFAVLSDDAAAIAKAPGIGKKTAQKLILELKDKFSLEEAFEKKLAANQQDAAEPVSEDAASEAVQALVALGYSGTEALQAVRKVEGAADMDTEAVLKAALKNLF